MKTLLLTVMLLAAGALAAQNYTSYFTGNPIDTTTAPTGGVCMMGGASENDEAMRWFLMRASGGDVLVLRASGSNGYNDYLYSELGIAVNSVETIVCNNAASAGETYIQQKIQQAEAIWFAGGDQWNYVSYWRNTAIDSLINDAIASRNIVIGGTSAGMAILGGYYFSAQNGSVTSAAALANPYNSNVTVDSESFLHNALLEEVVTDTHYDNPDRRGRHVVFMARMTTDHGTAAKGIACDEYTAVCIPPDGIARVYGDYPSEEDNAYFIRANCEATGDTPETCLPGTPLTWNRNGIALAVYVANLNTWETGSGGSWENWSVDNGVLTTAAATQPDCGLSLPELTPAVVLFPNPSTDALTVVSDVPVSRITLRNTVGQTIRVTEQLSFSIEDLPAGAYLIEIVTEGGTVVRSFTKR
jgi:cyanophycinase-like exopeptidase